MLNHDLMFPTESSSLDLVIPYSSNKFIEIILPLVLSPSLSLSSSIYLSLPQLLIKETEDFTEI